MKSAPALVLYAATVLGVIACGQVGGGPDASADAHVDAGWTQCSSPDGYAVCGELTGCPACNVCNDGLARVGLCDGQPKDALLDHPCYAGARDGEVCISYDENGGAFFSGPATIGRLLAQNGAKGRVHFGDMSEYELGVETPLPTSCPTWQTAQACGGPCGACPQGFECAGRGPLHPVGWCRALDVTGCKSVGGADGGLKRTCGDSGKSCFTFTVVGVVAQGDADYWGACIPTAMCEEMATTIPGGAKCSK